MIAFNGIAGTCCPGNHLAILIPSICISAAVAAKNLREKRNAVAVFRREFSRIVGIGTSVFRAGESVGDKKTAADDNISLIKATNNVASAAVCQEPLCVFLRSYAAVLLLNPKGGTVTHEGSLTNDQSSAACSGSFIDRKSAVGLKMTVIYSQTGRGIVIIIENRIYASIFWPGIAAAVNGKRCAPAQKDCLFQIIFSTLLNLQVIQSHICGAGNINAAGTATVFSCYKTGRMLYIDDARTLAVTDSNCSRSDLKRRVGQTMPVQLDGQVFTDLDLLLSAIIRRQQNGGSWCSIRYRILQSGVPGIADICHIAVGKRRCGQHTDHQYQR